MRHAPVITLFPDEEQTTLSFTHLSRRYVATTSTRIGRSDRSSQSSHVPLQRRQPQPRASRPRCLPSASSNVAATCFRRLPPPARLPILPIPTSSACCLTTQAILTSRSLRAVGPRQAQLGPPMPPLPGGLGIPLPLKARLELLNREPQAGSPVLRSPGQSVTPAQPRASAPRRSSATKAETTWINLSGPTRTDRQSQPTSPGLASRRRPRRFASSNARSLVHLRGPRSAGAL